MLFDTAFLITAFVTLFVIIDPIGLAPMFIAITQGMSQKKRRGIALRAVAVGGAVLFLFSVFGESVLSFVGISMPAFRIAGGVLLFLTALEMLFNRRTKRREDQSEDDGADDPSVFPLAIPLIAGPGAITSVILITENHPSWLGIGEVTMVVAAVLVLVYVMFSIGTLLEQLLGKIGINVITRILGMLLAALAVQFVLEGIAAFELLSEARH
ncbi:MAG: MarC family protein [Marinovum sp.]|nr:MarC family protein [Marinovum sp.]MBT7906019.1 MarC family protein [Marinovum sp.]